MIGSSVVPGLPNILVTPSSLSTRRKASRPVMVLETRASGMDNSLFSFLPRHTGEGREGEGRKVDLRNFRSERPAWLDWGFPPPCLPRMTGEERNRQHDRAGGK